MKVSNFSLIMCTLVFPTKGFICCTEFFVGHQDVKMWHKQKQWLRSFPGNCWKICWELTWISKHSGRDTFYHTNSCLVDTRDSGCMHSQISMQIFIHNLTPSTQIQSSVIFWLIFGWPWISFLGKDRDVWYAWQIRICEWSDIATHMQYIGCKSRLLLVSLFV